MYLFTSFISKLHISRVSADMRSNHVDLYTGVRISPVTRTRVAKVHNYLAQFFKIQNTKKVIDFCIIYFDVKLVPHSRSTNNFAVVLNCN